MTPAFDALDQQAQISALETLGRAALAEFGVVPTAIESLVHFENTTFRVDSDQGRFCLRISRPGYQSTENIRSELAFLGALVTAGFTVPKPWQGRLVTASAPLVPEARDCVLFHWIDGEFLSRHVDPEHGRQVGDLIARLHDFVANWAPPPHFARQHLHAWADAPRSRMSIDEPSDMIEEEDRLILLEEEAAARTLLNGLAKTTDSFALIHGDLHFGNLLLHGEAVCPIDFDDSGYGFLLYDFAAALAYAVGMPGYEAFRAAVIDGYASVRPLPPDTRELLDPFLRLRLAGVGRWVVDRSDNPELRRTGKAFVKSLCDRIRTLR